MPNLTIVAHIHAAPEHTEFVRAELEKLVDPTRGEAGCIQYDLHQDNQNPNHFMFYENWETHELWQAHSASQHIQAFRSAIEGKVESVNVQQLTLIR